MSKNLRQGLSGGRRRGGASGAPVRASASAPRAGSKPLHFHHVHLNSVDPKAAAEYYPKPFALSATKTTFNGLEAVKTGNIYILFTKVATRRRTS